MATEDPVFEGLPSATREAYESDWYGFVSWCREVGEMYLPASDSAVIAYIEHLTQINPRTKRPYYSQNTLTRKLTSINFVHKSMGLFQVTRSPAVSQRLREMRGTPEPEVLPDSILMNGLRKVDDSQPGRGLAVYRDRLILLLRIQV